jgi:hypothetical protein
MYFIYFLYFTMNFKNSKFIPEASDRQGVSGKMNFMHFPLPLSHQQRRVSGRERWLARKGREGEAHGAKRRMRSP